MTHRWLVAVATGLAVLAQGCSDDPDGNAGSAEPPRRAERPATAPTPQDSHCPEGLANCQTAAGRIIYVERVDPDGDGDAHFVLASGESITAPGLSVIDVRRELRPDPLPGPGDRLSAAGPVYRGTYGQRQIEAIELHVASAN